MFSQQKFKRSLSKYGVLNVQLARGFSADEEYGEIDAEFERTLPPIHATVPAVKKGAMKKSLSRYDRFLDAAISTSTIDSSDDEKYDALEPFIEENNNNSLRAQRKKFTSRYELFQQQSKVNTQSDALKVLQDDDEEYGEIVPDIIPTNLTLPTKTVKDKQILKNLVSRYSHFEDAPRMNVELRDSDDEDYGKLEEDSDLVMDKSFNTAPLLQPTTPSLRLNIVTAVGILT